LTNQPPDSPCIFSPMRLDDDLFFQRPRISN
jgi:hypothetical protein